jgi:hypothetical protein
MNMRSIREMLGNDEKVWVYFESVEWCRRFFELAEGFSFGDLPEDEWKTGYVIAVNKTGRLGHVSLLMWCMSFGNCVNNCPRRVDFRKYIEGDSEYLCHSSHFSAKLLPV